MTANNQDKVKYDLYLKGAKTALNNSTLLYDEANLLMDENHHARGFALCVLSMEESSKAFLYRYISLNLHNEINTLRLIRNHEKKLYQSQVILSTSLRTVQFFFEIMIKFHEVMKDERQIANIRNKLVNNKLEFFEKGIEMLKHMHGKKLDSLYVDIRNGKIIDPNTMLSKKQIHEIIDLVKVQIDIVNNIIMSEDNLLMQMWKLMPVSPFVEDNTEDLDETVKELLKFMEDMKKATDFMPDQEKPKK